MLKVTRSGQRRGRTALTIATFGCIALYAARAAAQAPAVDPARDIDAAERLSRELELSASLSPVETAALLNDLGNAYIGLDDTLQGLAAFADAERIAPPATPLHAIAAINVVRALEDGGAFEGLDARLDAVQRETAALDSSSAKAAVLLALAGRYRSAAGRMPGPDRYASTAAQLAADALAIAERSGDDRLLAEAHAQIALVRADERDLDAAIAHTRQAVTIAQNAGANEALYRWEWQLGRLQRSAGRNDVALIAYEAAIETLRTTQVAAMESRRGFVSNVLPLFDEYADLMLAVSRDLPESAAEAALLKVQQTLEILRVAEVRNYFENQCSVPEVFDSRAKFPDRAVVIYPLVFPDRTEIVVGTGERLRQFTVPVDLPRLTAVVQSLRRALEDPDSGDGYLAQAQLLYGWLIEPMREMLEQTAPSTLIFVPDGPLRTIPFAALHDGREFLVERYALGITPALSLVGAVNVQPISRVLVNGIIAPTRGFAGLPFVAEELASIERTFPSRVYADDSFLTTTLEQEIVAGGYSVVHMATHAKFESDYRRSFLVAHDDLITMNDLEDTIGGRRFSERPVDLLVLSACQTAAGDERAALGLAGVAVKAGARSALASLWAVNDESTSLLIAEFYRQLAANGGKAEALRGAQLALFNDARYSHPAYWAPFLMIGDWR